MSAGFLSAGSSLIGSAFGYASAQETNRLSAAEASKNRRFQREMARSKFQYQKEDLLKANLNPMLAVGLNPATPSGSGIPHFENPASSARESAVAIGNLLADLKNKKSQNKLLNAQTEETTQRAALAQANAKLSELMLPQAKRYSEMYDSKIGALLPWAEQLQKFMPSLDFGTTSDDSGTKKVRRVKFK